MEPMNNFTPRAQQVLALARKEADRLRHSKVDTEHLLLGLIKLGQGTAFSVLVELGFDLETLRREVELRAPPENKEKTPVGSIPYTPRVKKVLALAGKEAKSMNHSYVGTEHIMLGILSENQGVAAQIFSELKIDIDRARQEVLRQLNPEFSEANPVHVRFMAQGLEGKASVTAQAELKSPSRPRSVETRLGNDGATTRDTLNRINLARVLAEFLRDERTQTPLTLSIEGRWGSGKTNFMRLLQNELDPPAQEQSLFDKISNFSQRHLSLSRRKEITAQAAQRRLRSFWFNPWRHQTHEELWAAFALSVLDEARKNLHWRKRLWADCVLHWSCVNRRRLIRSAMAVFIKASAFMALLLFVYAFVQAGGKIGDLLKEMQGAGFWWDSVGLPLTFSAPAILLLQCVYWVWKAVGGHLRHDLEIHLDRPDYASRAGFLSEFHRDFAQAMRIYTDGSPLVVLIDDLDRCDVPRAAELMQGINLMLGENAPLIYVLGMDRAKVAAGIAVKHKDLLPFLYARELALASKDEENQEIRTHGLEYGYEFIEKFIQLPFRLPPSEREELRTFIRSRLTQPELTSPAKDDPRITVAEISSGVPAYPIADEKLQPIVGDESHLEEPLLHASRVLDGNPRRIAQLINLVRLQKRLAPLLRVNVRDGQLAKWTAVALRWPVFLVELEQERGLLEKLVAASDPQRPTLRYKRWSKEIELVGCLRDHGPIGSNSADYDLTQDGVVNSLLRLGIAIPVAEVNAPSTAISAKLS